jgi:hypothetical protein
VLYAEPDDVVHIAQNPVVPNDPYFPQLWSLSNSGQPGGLSGADIHAPQAWAIACLEYLSRMKDRGLNLVATNNSWGGRGFSQAMRDAIDSHRQRGILFVAAAGNESLSTDRFSGKSARSPPS